MALVEKNSENSLINNREESNEIADSKADLIQRPVKQLEKEKEKKKEKKFSPPFDPFGIAPEFYMSGKSQTRSWIGCFCSIVEIVITALVIFFYSRSFIRKENPNITILDLKSDEKPFMDLKEAK